MRAGSGPLVAGLSPAAARPTRCFSRAPTCGRGSFVTDDAAVDAAARRGCRHRLQSVLLAAMGDVEPHESGLASGVVGYLVRDGRRARLAILVSPLDGSHRSPSPPAECSARGPQRRFQLAFAVGAVA